jgi:uncharacterized phage protein (TIGR01671 family)
MGESKREIKFRAWDGEKIYLPSDSDTYIKLISGELRSPGIILMQCTGLDDKNGKEIFEGDILRVGYNQDASDNLEVVKFWEGRWLPLVRVEYGYNAINRYDSEMFEVMGNIYENKELLNG